MLFRKNSGLTFLKKYTEQTARPLCQNTRCRLAAGFCLSCFLKISESFGALQSRNAFSFRLLCCAKIFICREKDRRARAGNKKFPEKLCPKLLNRRKICAILFVALQNRKDAARFQVGWSAKSARICARQNSDGNAAPRKKQAWRRGSRRPDPKQRRGAAPKNRAVDRVRVGRAPNGGAPAPKKQTSARLRPKIFRKAVRFHAENSHFQF